MLEQSYPTNQKLFKESKSKIRWKLKRFSKIYFAVVSFLNLYLLLGCNQDTVFLRLYYITTFHNTTQFRVLFIQKKYLENRVTKWLDSNCCFSSQHLKVFELSYFFKHKMHMTTIVLLCVQTYWQYNTHKGNCAYGKIRFQGKPARSYLSSSSLTLTVFSCDWKILFN